MTYCAFPRLWDLVGDRYWLLHRPFETIAEAAKLQAMVGDEAALAKLKSTVHQAEMWVPKQIRCEAA